MKITLVHYERLFNTGNYQNQKIGVEALLEEGDDPAGVLTQLRAFVADQDPDLVSARAILAHPDGQPGWMIRDARVRLGLPVEPAPASVTYPVDPTIDDPDRRNLFDDDGIHP